MRGDGEAVIVRAALHGSMHVVGCPCQATTSSSLVVVVVVSYQQCFHTHLVGYLYAY